VLKMQGWKLPTLVVIHYQGIYRYFSMLAGTKKNSPAWWPACCIGAYRGIW